jgi:hypothetical protein
MGSRDIFISVGGTSNDKQERFVCLLEDRLRSEGLIPHTVGRNTFSVDAPLRTVEHLLDRCIGTVVIALERSYFSRGIEKRGGSQEKVLEEIRLATPWNHIEAAMSYVKRKPLLVIVEKGLKSEGLIESGYDWYVQTVSLDENALATKEFNGVLASWKAKLVEDDGPTSLPSHCAISPATMTIAQLAGALQPSQLWSLLTGLAALIAGAFALGGKLLA